MRALKNLILLVVTLFSTTSVFAETETEFSKLDPMLKMLSEKSISVDTARAIRLLKEAPGQEPMVKTIVRFKENLNGVDALGGEIGSIMGDIVTLDIPLNSLENLSRLENIVYVEASKKAGTKVDISVPETRADQLRGGGPPPWTGVTGKNVIVGIVDTGIDLAHSDFHDSTGKTRILHLLDQTTRRECTNTVIDNGTCSEIDTVGHGTHVAGIISGNGSVSNYRYTGMAPEADFVIVKTTLFTTDILNGISYIQQKATSFGKPSVINLSLGGHIDPHDGTSNFSRGLDNASGPGRIIVGAAGNEARRNIHASGFVSPGSETINAFNIPSGETAVLMDIWYPGNDLMNINIITPDCGETGSVEPGNSIALQTACGKITIGSALKNPFNGDKEILILLENPSSGIWNFSLYGSTIQNGRFDAWIDETATFLAPDSSITLSDTAVTTQVIGVGSYVTRPVLTGDPLAGDRSAFSSHGPRRLCSICNTVQKPDISAPGQWLMSAFSKDTQSFNGNFKDPHGGPYIMYQGTSMATPHVAGAIALLLQKNSILTPEDIKLFLSSTAATDQNTGNVPNFTWGYGKLNAESAFSTVPAENLFSDVPADHWAFFYIRSIYHAHITTGCSQDPLEYCPEDNVTRGQVAAFIIRAKHGENFSFTQTPYFSDVPATQGFFKYVQKLKDTGLTAVSDVYGVDTHSTRGQVAAFIIRSRYGENFTFTPTQYFSDVPPTHGFFKYVQKLKDDHLTTVSNTYGVDDIVTRAQMAAFLARPFLGMQ